MSRPDGRLARYRERASALTPPALGTEGRVRRGAYLARGIAVLALLDLNDALVRRSAVGGRGWWPTDDLAWVHRLESAVPEIRRELDAYLADRVVPSTAVVNGFADPEVEENDSIPGGSGTWRVLLLQTFDRPIPSTARHFPATMAALAASPAISNIGFSCMDPHSRISEHRDPNRGALRFQLPIVVPGEPGDCWIRVGSSTVAWEEGKGVLFDLAELHETANESDGSRILLMFEVLMPTPFPLSLLNRAAQWSYRLLPTFRGLPDRAEALASAVPAPDPQPAATDPVEPARPAVPASDLPPAEGPPDGPSRPTLRDPDRQAELEEFGFAVVPALSPELLDQVRATYARLGPAPDDPQLAINWSFHSQSAAYKHEVKAELLSLLAPTLEQLLDDHVAYLTTFITKWPGPHSAFAPHQDPSLVDERSFRGVTVWIPLHDTGLIDGRDNGMLHVVPGSHRFSRALRRSDVDHFQFADHEGAIVDHLGLGVPTVAGEALVFDNRVVHYSKPNETDDPRVVLSFGVRPTEARCVLLRDAGDDAIDLFEVPDDFYIDVLPAEHHRWQPPSPPIATLRAVHPSWTPAELEELCASVGPAPRTMSIALDSGWQDPGVFCASCGSSEGLTEADRHGRNNAQLICPSCQRRLDDERAAGVAGS